MIAEKVEKVVDGLAAPTAVSVIDHEESSSTEANIEYDEKMTKQLIRKIDWHILPVLVILYLLSFLDRTNIGNARLAGLEKGLNMSGLDYNVCTGLMNLNS